MITLQPPPERDLPVRRNADIRAAVLRVAAPAPPRRTRWVIAVAAVLVLVIAAVGIPRLLAGPDVAVPVATPSAAATPPTTTPSTTTPSTAAPSPALPSGRVIDRGPLGRSDQDALIQSCQRDLQRYVPVQEVLYARDTTDGPAALVRDDDGSVYGCSDSGSSLLSGPDSKSGRLPTTSAERPIVALTGPGISSTASGHRMTSQAGGGWWAVTDQVAVLQLRVRHDGDVGPWFDAAVSDGFAYGATASQAFAITSLPLGSRPAVDVDVRAYRADGRRLEIDGRPR